MTAADAAGKTPDTPAPALAAVTSLVRAQRWDDLLGLLAGDDAASLADALVQDDREFLGLLASGAAALEAGKEAPPRLPSYALSRALADSPAVAERLLAIARGASSRPCDDVIVLLRAAIAIAPGCSEAALALAWACFDAGRGDDAIRAARLACNGSAADHPDGPAALGWMLLAAGDLAGAEAVLVGALARHPRHAPLHWYLGTLRFRQRQLDAARVALATALRLDPGLDEAATTLAWVLHDLGQLVEATIWARRACQRQPRPDRQAQLGWLLLCRGDHEAAARLLVEALAAAPGQTEIRCHLARAWQALGRVDDARELLQEGLTSAPDAPDLLLALAWLHCGRGELEPARWLAERLIEAFPERAAGWHLLGVIWQDGGHPEPAEACFAAVEARDPTWVDALMRRAALLRQLQRPDAAAASLRAALKQDPADPRARFLQARVLLDLGRPGEARALAHELLAKQRRDGSLWHLLALALLDLDRPTLADLALQRACRLAPERPEIWQLRGWRGLETGNLALARQAVERLSVLAPDDTKTDIQAAFVLEACGELVAASTRAEAAVAADPDMVEAWRALAKVRYRQDRLEAAEEALRTALDLEPSAEEARQAYRQLGWVLLAANRLAEAEAAFVAGLGGDPDDPAGWLELAEVRHRAGRFADALAAVDAALRRRGDWPPALLWRARLLIDGGGEPVDAAIALAARALLAGVEPTAAAGLLVPLAASGNAAAAAALRLIDRPQRRRLFKDLLEVAQGQASHHRFGALTEVAVAQFGDDIDLATAEFYAAGLGDTESTEDMARRARVWFRRLSVAAGSTLATPMPARTGAAKLRVAYVAAHFHRSLLVAVLAAHDRRVVEVFLYTDAPREWLGELASSVAIQPLRGIDLAASMRANRIDVAIDTVGVHPFLGQNEVLRQFARRVAPVQCAWLGSWASAGGLFDAVIADAVSLPPECERYYEEQVVRLPGGQWCWEPPRRAPAIAPSAPGPSALTFGSAVRGLRLTHRTLGLWARILAGVPESRLELLGDHGQDWSFRAEFAALLVTAGVDPQRVGYRPRRRYDDHLDFYNEVDIALDAVPSNGGLSLLDPLWMGVPVVSRAGCWLGERQGLSVLSAIGHAAWASADDDAYVATGIALAADTDGRAKLRRSLRDEILASPLVGGRRAAAGLEDLYRQLHAGAAEVATAASAKERSRAVARRQFPVWRGAGRRIDGTGARAPDGAPPDVSVIVVLFNQVGLSRQTLAALADQSGVSYELIVVDNASTDATAELLDRLDGARIIRNAENLGFLRAARQGAAAAGGRHLLFLNSDAVLLPDALRHAVARLDGDAAIGAVGGRIVLADGSLQEAGCIAYRNGSTVGYGRGRDPAAPEFCFTRDVDFVSGAFLMLPRLLWDRLDGFDPAYAPAYYEDTDLCLRIWRAGFRVVYEPRVWVAHLEWGSATSNDEVHTLMECNRQRFCAAHAERLAARPLPAFAQAENDRWLARRRPRLLVVDNAVPHMAAGGGLPRARSLLHALDNHDVTLFPLWTSDEDWRDVRASIPDSVEVMLGHGAAGFERFLETRRGVYDAMIVSRPPNMAFVDALWRRRPELFRGVRLIYDAEAVFALRDIAAAAVRGRPLPRTEARRRLRAELVLAGRAQTVLAVAAGEARLFRAAGVADVCLLAHSMATRRDVPPFTARRGLLFVGALHADTPNEDGLLWFVREVMPRLAARGGQSPVLSIVGECRSAKIAGLVSASVQLVGPVDDLWPYYDRARVFVAPTRFAAGVPAKVIEAACNGIPVVASALLVRQLGWRAGAEILPARDAAAFAAAILRLDDDPDLWLATQQAAFERTSREYAPAEFARLVVDAVGPATH